MQSTEPTTETKVQSNIYSFLAEYDHEQVAICHDKKSGLKAIVAIHNTTLGPALGGTRFWNYATEGEAIYDVLRLSRGMTYKASISGINLGGGKAVIIGNSKTDKSEALWRRYGRFVEGLNGRYITAEDVGTTTADMEYIAEETDFVAGVPDYLGGGGDPSPVTAYGVYLGMKASLKKETGSDSLKGKKVAVQGVGHVGEYLVKHLQEEGAEIFVSDINEGQLKHIAKTYGATVVGLDEIYDVPMDIYAPCALGATVNDDTISRLKCSIIAGAANNQLADEIKHGAMLQDRGILYAPDFLINAGGLINCYVELGGYNRERAYATSDKIYDRTLEIYAHAEKKGLTSHQAAVEIAEQRIQTIADLHSRR